MAEKATNRRRTLVVNPKQQQRLIVTMSLVPAIGMTVTMGLICFLCRNLMQEAADLEVQLDSLMPLFLSVAGFVLVSGFFMITNALLISHRIAGPSYRLCKSIEKIRQGDVSFDVKLRNGDHLTDISDEVNKLLDVLNENPPAGFRTREMRAAEVPAESTAASTDESTAASRDAAAENEKVQLDVDSVPAPPHSSGTPSAGVSADR